MSRSIPPPIPVIAPSMTAWTGGTREASAVEAPAAEGRGPRGVEDVALAVRALDRVGGDERHQAGTGGGGQVAPVAERLWRAPDQQVAHDPSGHPHGDREHDDAERVEALAHARDPAA